MWLRRSIGCERLARVRARVGLLGARLTDPFQDLLRCRPVGIVLSLEDAGRPLERETQLLALERPFGRPSSTKALRLPLPATASRSRTRSAGRLRFVGMRTVMRTCVAQAAGRCQHVVATTPRTIHAHEQAREPRLATRHPGGARGPGTRRGHGRGGAAHLPDQHVRPGGCRSADRRLGVRAHRQSHPAAAGGRGRDPGGRRPRPGVRERLGDGGRDRGPGPAGRAGAHQRRRLRRHLSAVRAGAARAWASTRSGST